MSQRSFSIRWDRPFSVTAWLVAIAPLFGCAAPGDDSAHRRRVASPPTAEDHVPPPAEGPSFVEDHTARPLELADVLESAATKFPLLLVAREERAIASARRTRALGGIDTKTSVDADFMPLGFFENDAVVAKVEQPTTFYGAKVFGGYKLGDGDFDPTFDGGRLTNENGEFSGGFSFPLLRDRSQDVIRRDLRQAETREFRAEADVLAEYIETLRAAEVAYWKWREAGARFAVAEGLLELATTRQDGIAGRVARGDLAPIDSVDNERLVVERRSILIGVRRELEKASIKLSLYLRDAEGTPVRVGRERLPGAIPRPTRSPSIDAADDANVDVDAETLANSLLSPADRVRLAADVERALKQRPELQQMLRDREALAIELEFLESQLLPRLDVGVEGSQDIDGRRPSVTKGEFELVASVDFEYALQNRKAKGKLRETESKFRQLDEKLRFTVDKIEAEVRDARSAVRAAIERSREATRAAGLAEELAEAERRKFELGDSDLLRVNLREEIAAEASAKAIKATAEFWVAEARYRAVIGDFERWLER